MQALKRGGTFVLVGMGAEACNCFPSLTLVWKEADVKGCFRYTNTVSISLPLTETFCGYLLTFCHHLHVSSAFMSVSSTDPQRDSLHWGCT